IHNEGFLSLQYAVVTGNSATDKGAGIFSNTSITPGDSGIALNVGYCAIINNQLATAQGTGGAAGIAVEAGGLSLESSTVSGNTAGTSSDPIDPKLGLLQDNGGATPTMAVRDSSPAIDGGSNPGAGPGIPVADQRGFTRVVNGTMDIGAFEFGATRVALDLSL